MSNNPNQIFQYNGSPISFHKGDSVMVNATQMAKPFGKVAKDWLRTKQTQEFIQSLSAVRQISLTGLVEVQQGGNGEQGTWMHEDVALEFARWLSPAFAIWCNDRIKELLTTGVTTVELSRKQLAQMVIEAEEEKERLALENEKQQKQIEKLQAKADFADAAFRAEGRVDIGQAAKILGLPFGRNTLFKKLREDGIFYSDRNEPKQRYIDAGYFILTQLPPIHRENHPDIIHMKVICEQKGLAFINKKYGGNPSDSKLARIV